MMKPLNQTNMSNSPKISIVKLSWKQKLTTVVVLTLIGLAVVAIFAFIGLYTVNNSALKQQVAATYKQATLSFKHDLLALELSSLGINADNIDGFSAEITALVDKAQTMEEEAQALGYSELISSAQRIIELAKSYQNARQRWRENRESLGFAENQGVLKRIFSASNTLAEQSFSMIEADVSALITGQKSYLITKSANDEAKTEAALSNLETTVIDMDWQDIDIGKAVASYREAFSEARQLVNLERDIINEMQPLLKALNATSLELNQHLDDIVIQRVLAQAKQAKSKATRVIAIAATLVALIILISLGMTARQLSSQISQMQALMKRVAEGDFSTQLSINHNEKDEFTQLRSTSNQMIGDISAVISQVVDGNLSLQHIRDQLEDAVDKLHDSSVEVEQKTQQSTMATQQISIAVNDVAKRSVQVSETAQSASQSTKEGGKVVNDCVQSMVNIVDMIQNTNAEVSKLNQSSSEMLGIIDVINGLADQTNLLALNAAIESARAGEAGRGFSVVADEVRALAQKTVGATSSISEIIKNFNDQTKRMGELMEKGIVLASSGQDNANNAMSSFENIEASTQRVAAEMDQVVVAVEEISYNTNDIAAQIADICTQSENVKITREVLEGHTQELSSQAVRLAQSTSRFTLAQG
ncbi:MAG: methyl-accepting chemotaxis protein [Pseudomonadota bacterium]